MKVDGIRRTTMTSIMTMIMVMTRILFLLGDGCAKNDDGYDDNEDGYGLTLL